MKKRRVTARLVKKSQSNNTKEATTKSSNVVDEKEEVKPKETHLYTDRIECAPLNTQKDIEKILNLFKGKICEDCAAYVRGWHWLHGTLDTGECYKKCRRGKINGSDTICVGYEIDTKENSKYWSNKRSRELGLDEETYGHAF